MSIEEELREKIFTNFIFLIRIGNRKGIKTWLSSQIMPFQKNLYGM